uniref:Ubiquitin carboxyl-terminal hydrolase n=1 Tax=Eptatretus burgeri TaxID=7764 RepID=A0A8C4WYX7_EPTBU
MADPQEAAVGEGGGSDDGREPNAVGQPADEGCENSNIPRFEESSSDPPLAGEMGDGDCGECDVISLDDCSVSEDGVGAVDGVDVAAIQDQDDVQANRPACEREDRVGLDLVDTRPQIPNGREDVSAEARSTTGVDSESRAVTSVADDEEEVEEAPSKSHAARSEVSCSPEPRVSGEAAAPVARDAPRVPNEEPGLGSPGEDGPDREDVGVDPGSSTSDADTAAGTLPEEQAAGKDKYPIYHIKWLKWKGESTAIITQNENGPCPLLAIMNVLLLSWKMALRCPNDFFLWRRTACSQNGPRLNP